MSNHRISKNANNKVGEFNLVKGPFPYRAREDRTTLPGNTLVSPSRNVVNNTASRLQLVKGYTVDGDTSTVIDSGILSNYDFHNFKGSTRNMRAGFMTTAANDGKLQFRYVDSTTNVVSWVDLLTSLTSITMSFCDYWDNSALIKYVLWVDGSSNIYKWNGAVTTFASGTAPVAGVITTISSTPTAAGSGYATGDTFNITTGGTGATGTVVSQSGGAVSAVSITLHGSGYTTGAGKATTNIIGSGTGLTVNITAISTVGTITKQGTTTWQQEGFTSTGSFTIGATTYTYTGGYTTTTLTGVSADTSGTTVGAELHQTPVTTALSTMTAILSTFKPTVIGCGRRNQVYVGSSISNNLYISKVNDFTDYSFTSPTRVVGEGSLIPLDSPPTAFMAQEVTAAEGGQSAYDMWISEGLSTWAVIRATLSNDLTKETLEHIRLKVSPLQGAKGTKLVSKMRNHILYVDNNNVANFIGYISYQYVPTIVDFSYPIVDDMVSYDLTDGSVFFNKNYAYIAIPRHGLIRVYNMTDQTKDSFSQYKAIEDVTQMPWYWEAPITYPISGFYVTENGELGGHGYNSSESFILFSGGSFNGQNIDAEATLAYTDLGDRTQSKGSNEVWVEGYIQQNTTLETTINEDIGGLGTSQTVNVVGNDDSYVSFTGSAHSLGSNPLGSLPLGGAITVPDPLPAWFHVSKTYTQNSYYLEQLSFATNGVDLDWQLITFGTNATFTPEGNNAITD